MASKHREQKIIAAVACPTCGAPLGRPCRQSVAQRAQATDGLRRLVVCRARREAWQLTRDPPPAD